jgi:outer membrane protein TolC
LFAMSAEAQTLHREPMKLSLKQAIQRALAHNPRVLDQIEELYRARAQTEQVASQSLPTIYVNGTYTHLDAARTLAGTPPQTIVPQDAVTGAATAAMPVLAPKAWVQWAHARGQARVSERTLDDQKRQIAIAVAAAYLEVIARHQEVDLDNRARDSARAHAEYTRKKFSAGAGSHLDDVRARQDLEYDEQLVLTAMTALERAEETLGLLCALDQPVDVDEEPTLEAVDAVQATNEAPKLRADLLEIEGKRALAKALVRDAWADYMPSVIASFSPMYNWPATDFAPEWSWQFQLTVAVPIYDGGLRYGQQRERRALLHEAMNDQATGLRQMRSELRFGQAAVRRTQEAAEHARQAAELSHEAVKIADRAYRAGATTNLELIDAERRARDADTAAAIAENAARQARVDLLFAAGRLL